jgi:hypothetical protein
MAVETKERDPGPLSCNLLYGLRGSKLGQNHTSLLINPAKSQCHFNMSCSELLPCNLITKYTFLLKTILNKMNDQTIFKKGQP